jgi:two-component system OmpR family response regulator
MKILLVEDDETIAAFVKKGLVESGFMVFHASDGEEGLDLALNEIYDVAIIDIMLPKRDGLSIIEKMRKRDVNTPVIILSAKRTVDDRVRGLQTGGDDYLVKPFSFTELLTRTQVLIRRASGISEATTISVEDLSMNLITREITRAGKKVDLQAREFSLLEYLLRNTGRVVSKTMIMEHVWHYDFDPQTNVVEVRICKLRDKVDRGFDPPLIHTIRGVGYVLKKNN